MKPILSSIYIEDSNKKDWRVKKNYHSINEILYTYAVFAQINEIESPYFVKFCVQSTWLFLTDTKLSSKLANSAWLGALNAISKWWYSLLKHT